MRHIVTKFKPIVIGGITQLGLVGMGGLMPVQKIVKERCKAWIKLKVMLQQGCNNLTLNDQMTCKGVGLEQTKNITFFFFFQSYSEAL